MITDRIAVFCVAARAGAASIATALLVAFLVITTPAAAEIVVHVSPAGHDAWTGAVSTPRADGSDGPIASLERARDLVRAQRAQAGAAKEQVRVVLTEGRYRLARPLTFGPEDGGSANARVTYEAAPGAAVVISGGRPITGFRAGAGAEAGLWVADVPATVLPDGSADRWRFEQLFVNGRRAIRAREPDDSVYAVEGCREESLGAATPHEPPATQAVAAKQRLKAARQTLTLGPESAAALAAIAEADMPQVQVVVHHKWDVTRRFIETIAADRRQLTTTGLGMKPWNRWDPKSTVVLEDARAFLDEPGEWFLTVSGRLLYKPRPDESISTTEVVAPALEQVLVIRGDVPGGRMVEHLAFTGIAFEHAAWPMTRAGFEPTQAAASVAAAIMVDGARSIVFHDCRIAHVGGHAIWLRRGCRDCRVERCLIEDLGAGGVRIGDTALPNSDAEATAGNTLDNCIIRQGGRMLPCGAAVWVGHAADNAISHNDIEDFFYTGISTGWVWGYRETGCLRNRITDNHLRTIGQGLLSDMGGFYNLGPSAGTIVRGNVIHDVRSRTYGGWGLYTDEGSTGVIFEHNLVYDTTSGGFHQHFGRDNMLRHNVFVDARDWQVQVTRPEDHRSFTFERNIIVWKTGKSISGPWDKIEADTGHNCWWNSAGEPVAFLGKPLAEWQAAGHERGSIVADPGFVGLERHDYRLQPDSPARGLGFLPYDWTTAGANWKPPR